jgi:energy-converting hydrogenase A subunit M
MKTKKIGTIIDEEIAKRLKEQSIKESRSMSDIIQDALVRYFQTDIKQSSFRRDAVERLCSRPFNISVEELNEIMEEDYYDQ